jgi:hypothetical protein
LRRPLVAAALPYHRVDAGVHGRGAGQRPLASRRRGKARPPL